MGGINFTKDMIRDIPIPQISTKQQKSLVKLVDQILKLKSHDPKADTKALENQIDQMVYQLYDLSDDEIAVMEG
jgi:hypothetical protein